MIFVFFLFLWTVSTVVPYFKCTVCLQNSTTRSVLEIPIVQSHKTAVPVLGLGNLLPEAVALVSDLKLCFTRATWLSSKVARRTTDRFAWVSNTEPGRALQELSVSGLGMKMVFLCPKSRGKRFKQEYGCRQADGRYQVHFLPALLKLCS